MRGNLVEATDDVIISSFEMYLDAGSGCTSLDFYVLENTSSSLTTASNWSIAWSDQVSISPSSSYAYYNSGSINYAVSSGDNYALVVGWGCPVDYYYTGSDTNTNAGFGFISGYAAESSYSGYGSFSASDPNYYGESSSVTSYDTTVYYY